jgi:hypothetical protein
MSARELLRLFACCQQRVGQVRFDREPNTVAPGRTAGERRTTDELRGRPFRTEDFYSSLMTGRERCRDPPRQA